MTFQETPAISSHCWPRVATIVAASMVLLFAPFAVRAAAQDSRQDAIAAEQAKKAQELKPYRPDKAERIVVSVKEKFLEEPNGFFPFFASVYSGGGFTLGGGYRQFYGDRTFWDVKGLYSAKNYKFVEIGTTSRELAGGRVNLVGRTGWRDATQVAYFGLGMETSPEARTNFRMKQGYVGASVDVWPLKWLVFGGAATYEDYTLEEGQGEFPSIEAVHTPETAPGLGANPKYIHTEAKAAIDWRSSPGYSRKGGYYGIVVHDYADRDDAFSFKDLDAELVQHIPILRENWVISLRGSLQTEIGDNSNPPFFLLPSLGSGSTLRGYQSWRFRDRHALLMSAEWRWIPNRLGLDMAIFYDAGKVAAERKDLSLNGLKSDWGIGARFHGPISTPLRIEMAHGTEGWRLVFAGDAAF